MQKDASGSLNLEFSALRSTAPLYPSFFLLTLIVCIALVFGSAAVAARFIGRSLPPSGSSIVFESPCALPCVLNIVPGSARRDAAFAALEASGAEPVVLGVGLIAFQVYDPAGSAAQGLLLISFEDQQTVETVRISPIDPDVHIMQLGDLVLDRPAPAVFRSCSEVRPVRMLLLFGENREIIAEILPDGRLTPHTPLTLLDVSARNVRTLYDARASFGCSVEVEWRGFAALWRYFER